MAIRTPRVLALVPRASALLLTATLTLAPASPSQVGGINQGGPSYLHTDPTLNPMPRQSNSAEATRLEAMRQADRRRHLADDAQKLLDLSTAIKAEIDHAPKDQLSLETMRHTEEAEKVAHDLKKWLKT